MSRNSRVWLVAASAAAVGLLLGAGAVWATQQSTLAGLKAQLIRADAETQAALQRAQEADRKVADLATTESTAAVVEPEATATTAPETKAPATKQFTFVNDVRLSGVSPTLVADYAQMLTGSAAAAAAAAAGDESPPPNDYYISNVNKKVRTLQIKPGIRVNLATNPDGTSDPNGHFVTLAEWAADFAAPTADNAPIREAPYWIWIRDGRVVKIQQQYLP